MRKRILPLTLAAAMLLGPAIASAHPVVLPGPPPKPMHHHLHGHHHGGFSAEGYVGGAMFCGAGLLIAEGAYIGHTQHRQLNYGEAYGTALGCFIPVIGWFIGKAIGDQTDKCLYDRHLTRAYRQQYCGAIQEPVKRPG